jgi:hypothetical protein
MVHPLMKISKRIFFYREEKKDHLVFCLHRSLCFISPKHCSQIWYSSIDKLITQYRKHRACSDRRIVWLKNQYLSLYHENERFQGPTPMNAVLVFGGRQWNSSSLFSYERDHPSSKKPSSMMKSWSNLALRKRNKFEQVNIFFICSILTSSLNILGS